MYGTIVGGGIFLKLIKPIPRIVFSDKMVIFHKDPNGNPRLRFQSVQGRKFKMYYTTARLKVHLAVRDANNRLIAIKDESLKLTQEEHALMSSAIMYTHEIDSDSPLAGLSHATLNHHVVKFSLVVQGDESKGFMTTYSGRTWNPEDVFFGHKFAVCYKPNLEDPEALGTFDAEKIHDIEECNYSKQTRETIRKMGRGSIDRKESFGDNDMYLVHTSPAVTESAFKN